MNIYQEIWSADQSIEGNGIPALRPNERKFEEQGFIIVDEQKNSVGRNHRVIKDVHIPDSKQKTYKLCEALFDNYALERTLRERATNGETQEELNFIDAILETPPIQKAREFLEISLSLSISDHQLAAMIAETWFALGKAGNQLDASGFEHVFVGEQASKPTKIGGYHFWYKYWLDDGGQNIDGNSQDDAIQYLGTKYGGAEDPDKGILVPDVVTLQLEWEAPVGDVANPSSQTTKKLHKPIGGFFVGPSPEGLIALGLVRTRAKNIGKTAVINGSDYQLDLHRLDDNPKSIRTFFPRFLKSSVTTIITDDGHQEDNSQNQDNLHFTEASFNILAAMINPKNPEGGREFLQIINITDQIASLKDWQVVAPNGQTFILADMEVHPGEIFKFVPPVSQGIFRNKGGTILLKAPNGNIQQSCQYSKEQASEEGKPILF